MAITVIVDQNLYRFSLLRIAKKCDQQKI